MKLWRFLKSTARPGLKIFLLSLTAVLFFSCVGPPYYCRDDIAQIVEKICRKEFEIEARAWLEGETFWVYVFFDGEILDAAGRPASEFGEKSRRIFLALQRSFLNMEDPPLFYVFVLSGGEPYPAYLYRLGFVPDQVKFGMGLISLDEINRRTVSLLYQKDEVALDQQGYISRHDISIGEFIGYLVRQDLTQIYSAPDFGAEVRTIESYFQEGRLRIVFDISLPEKPKKTLNPLTKSKKLIKDYLETYRRPDEITKIKIVDEASGIKRSYTQPALFENR